MSGLKSIDAYCAAAIFCSRKEEATTHDKEEATEELTIEYLLNPSLYHSPYDLNSDLRFVDGNIQYYDCKPK